MNIFVRTRDRNKSELLKIMRESATFGRSFGTVSPAGEIGHHPLTVWYDEAATFDEGMWKRWFVPELPDPIKAQISKDMHR